MLVAICLIEFEWLVFKAASVERSLDATTSVLFWIASIFLTVVLLSQFPIFVVLSGGVGSPF